MYARMAGFVTLKTTMLTACAIRRPTYFNLKTAVLNVCVQCFSPPFQRNVPGPDLAGERPGDQLKLGLTKK